MRRFQHVPSREGLGIMLSIDTSETELAQSKKPFGRSINDFPNLSKAEIHLIECAAKGNDCTLGATRPEKSDDDNLIRPGLVRFLALGGDEYTPVHEHGVLIEGAYIDGEIDFAGADQIRTLRLGKCFIEGHLILLGAKAQSISLSGSRVAGVRGMRAHIAGTLFLAEGFRSDGLINLIGAKIDGDLTFSGGLFQKLTDEDPSIPVNPLYPSLKDVTIVCNRINVGGSVFMRSISSRGEIRFWHAKIGGFLTVEQSSLENTIGNAISLSGAVIQQALFLTNSLDSSKIKGDIDLTNGFATTIWCNPELQQKPGNIILDGFSYERIYFGAGFRLRELRAWLLCQPDDDLGKEFKPQPFEQLTKVLRETGHDEEARQIGYFKQRKLSRIRVHRASLLWKPALLLWRYLVLDLLVGYGYRPHRAIFIAMALWLACAWTYHEAAREGLFVLATPAIYLSAAMDSNGKSLSDVCRANWTKCRDARMNEYPRFNASMYAADLILPLVDFGQDDKWIPIKRSVTLAGLPMPTWWVRTLMWVEIGYGWIAGLVLAAVFSGAVKKD